MNPLVVRRFVFLMFIAFALTGGTVMFYDSFFERPPGDYETERGSMYLSTRDYTEAMENFDAALTRETTEIALARTRTATETTPAGGPRV